MSRPSPADDDAGARTTPPAPWVADVLLALSMTLVIALVVATDAAGTDGAGEATGHGAGAYLFAAGFGALVLLRRRAPVVMVVATVLAVFAYYALGFAPIGMALPAVGALYAAAELDRTRWAVGSGAVLIVVATFFRVTDDDPSATLTVYDLVTNVALVAAAVALGVAVRLTRGARKHTEAVRALTAAEQARAADQRLQAERMRIARDLHDVVGHNLSVVALHTGVASEAVGRNDDGARTALRHVREATSATLHELRATVKVLRRPLHPDGAAGSAQDRDEPGTHHRETLPAATGPAGLAALVEPARASGLTVSTRVEVPTGSIDATVDAAAYRIVQESLTNVLRHSGARAALVRLAVTDGRLRIMVTDDGRGAGGAPGAWPAGAGIDGMRERAYLLGGTLRAHDAPDGGFTVVADLPARLDA
ncbi:sensor histidine kinase [Isoptericola croceus]|uniref:sensor histidine kinase n=1 Tax=Isoptericola croceus TaxID=3031406 RepID=UPI0023F70CE2|nr:histidine kinase [Isoptericola croceus]